MSVGRPNPDPATQQQTPFVMATTAVPCTGSATAAGVFTDTSTDPASNSENCYGYQITVTGSGSTLTTTPNYYGVLSTADNATSPAFAATPGYDLATGLGTPNVYALVNAPQWSGLSITTTTLAQGVVGIGVLANTCGNAAESHPTPGVSPPAACLRGFRWPPPPESSPEHPTAAGTSTFTVQVADAESTPATATASLSLTVAAGAGARSPVQPCSPLRRTMWGSE